MDSEESGNKAPEEHQKTDQPSSDPDEVHYTVLATERKLNIPQNDQWKTPLIVHDCQDSDPESMVGTTGTFSLHLNTQRLNTHVSQQELDLELIMSCKVMVKKSESSCFELNKLSITPSAFMDYVENKKRADSKPTVTTEEGREDYSRVSRVYNDTMLVLQKHSVPIHTHKERNCEELPRKIKDEKSFPAKDAADAQDYVTTM